MDDDCRKLLSESIQEANEVWDRWAVITNRKDIRPDVWSEAYYVRLILCQVSVDLEAVQERYA